MWSHSAIFWKQHLLYLKTTFALLWKHLFYSENNTCFQNKRLTRPEKNKWQNISGWKMLPFPRRAICSSVQPLCNLCHRFFLTSLTTFSSLTLVFLALSNPSHSFSLTFYLNSSAWPPPAPLHYPHLSSLFLPFMAISSPQPSVILILTKVMSPENVPLE